jgi:maleylpyruvate isomerase
MKLYGYWRSSASWRVRIALHLKGLAYENVPVHLVREGGEQRKPEFAQQNPMEQVPVLVTDEGDAITQSLAILLWLEARFPTPPLLPADPLLRARAWAMAEIVNSGIQPLQNLRVLQALKAGGLDPDAWAREHIARGLTALEHQARGCAGAFLVGDAPTVADICLIPQLYNARRYGVPLDAYPTLLRAEASAEAFPAFAAARPEAQPDAQPA